MSERKPFTERLVVAVLLTLAAPLSPLGWAAGTLAVQRGARRWVLALAGLVPGAAAAVLLGHGMARHGAAALLGVAAHSGVAVRPSTALLAAVAGTFLRWAMVTAPLAIPAGLVAAAIPPRDPQAPVPQSGPRQRRQRQRTQQRASQRTDRLAANEAADPRSPAFGVWLGGDLERWRIGDLVCLPPGQLGLATLLLGQPGVGKSNASGHLARLAALERRHVALVDGKGGDGLAELVAAYVRRVWPDARIRSFPDEPFDLWRGDPMQLVAKLSACWTFSAEAEFYRNVAELALRLALAAPTGKPCRSMRALVDRLEPNALSRLWQGHQTELSIIRDLKPRLADVAVRVSNLAASLGSRFDGGWSWEDCDVALVTIPSLANMADANAAMRILVADYGQYLTSRDRRPAGQRDLLLFDEFAALEGGRRSAINLVERSRSARAGVILSGQSDVALGDQDERERLKLAVSAVVEFRSPAPASPALAGTVRELDGAWQADEHGLTGKTTLTERHRARADADEIRAAETGVATIVSQGRWARVKVLPPPAAEQPVKRQWLRRLLARSWPFGTLALDRRALVRRSAPRDPGQSDGFPVEGWRPPQDHDQQEESPWTKPPATCSARSTTPCPAWPTGAAWQ